MQDTFCENEISLMPFSECLLQNTFYKMLAVTYVCVCVCVCVCVNTYIGTNIFEVRLFFTVVQYSVD